MMTITGITTSILQIRTTKVVTSTTPTIMAVTRVIGNPAASTKGNHYGVPCIVMNARMLKPTVQAGVQAQDSAPCGFTGLADMAASHFHSVPLARLRAAHLHSA